MLRVIYFLSLLLCVRSIFCYDHIRDESRNLKFIHRKYRNGIHRQFEDITKKYESDFDKESAHIDVASFIQNPDQLENDQIYPDNNEFRESSQNEYNNYGSVNENSLKDLSRYDQASAIGGTHNKVHDLNVGDLIVDHTNRNAKTNENIPFNKGTYDFSLDHNVDHYPAKKCVLKKMKVPFFFRDPEKGKPKQHKKRKLFHFHKFRKGKKNVSNVTETTSVKINNMDTTLEHHKLIKRKRSYFEMLCPACQQKFIERFGPHKRLDMENDIIHNSRQHYKTSVKTSDDYANYLKSNGGVPNKNYFNQVQ